MTDQDDKQLPLFEFETSELENSEGLPKEVPADETQFSKYIVYVDESGDHSLQSIDDNYPIFVLAFCVFHKRHYSDVIVPALEKFKFNHFGHDQIVLHENEIRKRNIKKSDTDENPYHIALGFCMETLFNFLSEKQQQTRKTHIVVECRGAKEDKELELEFRRICDGNNRLGIPLPFEILFPTRKLCLPDFSLQTWLQGL